METPEENKVSFNDLEMGVTSCFEVILKNPAFYFRWQRAKWLPADIWRLPRGSNTSLPVAGALIPWHKEIGGKALKMVNVMNAITLPIVTGGF